EQAVALRQHVPAFVSVTALFVNASPAEVEAVVNVVQPDLLQFHGDETPDQCRQYGRPYMRAIRVGGLGTDTPENVLTAASAYGDAAAWRFDPHSQAYGGTGTAFDHQLLEAVAASPHARPWVLAGGLAPDTVSDVIVRQQPYAVDVSSGVEEAPGIKSAARMAQFVQAVKDADAIRSRA